MPCGRGGVGVNSGWVLKWADGYADVAHAFDAPTVGEVSESCGSPGEVANDPELAIRQVRTARPARLAPRRSMRFSAH